MNDTRNTDYKTKLIEVALPLDDINAEASLRKRKAPAGYPTALHKWWAQRPPAAARAVLFAQMVNDPGLQQGQGFRRGKNKKEAARERERLFDIIRDLVKWENTNNEEVLERARAEIRKSWEEAIQSVKDAGGKPYAIPAGASVHKYGGLGYVGFAEEVRAQEAQRPGALARRTCGTKAARRWLTPGLFRILLTCRIS